MASVKKSGGYVMILCQSEDSMQPIGRLGIVETRKGLYAYVGSALNGLDQRVSRHLRKKKKRFWHIDYLTSAPTVKICRVLSVNTSSRVECLISQAIKQRLHASPDCEGFGSSDCECETHLYRLPYDAPEEATSALWQMLTELGLDYTEFRQD